MKPTNEDLVELYRIWSFEVLVRAAASGTWEEARTKEAILIRDSIKKNILSRMKVENVVQ